MSRALDDIDPRFKPLAMELIARCVERGIAVMIVDTLRNEAEQELNLARGTSATKSSRHLPQLPDGKSLAVDLCPYETYQRHGLDKLAWDPNAEEWRVMGEIGERLGLRWGGRWERPFDPGHFELPVTDQEKQRAAQERAAGKD